MVLDFFICYAETISPKAVESDGSNDVYGIHIVYLEFELFWALRPILTTSGTYSDFGM